MPVCDKCKEEKDVSEFYILRNKKPARYCKLCFMERQKAYRKKERYNTGIISQDNVMRYMRSQGIYIMPGRENNRNTNMFVYCDAVAWGCVKIEIKKSVKEEKNRGWSISFTDDQIIGGVKGDFVVIVHQEEDKNHYYVLPRNFRFFYKNGVLKHRVMFTQDSKRDDGRYESLCSYEDSWHLIEDRRQEIAVDLIASG